MPGKFTREERTAGYLAYTAIGLVTGTIAALAQNSLYTGGWPLPLLAGALGALTFFAVDRLTKATPKSQDLLIEQDDPEHSQLQNLRTPGDTPDHPQAPDDKPDGESGMGAAGRTPNNVIAAHKPEQETPTEKPPLKPLHKTVKPHIALTTKGQEGPHSATHVAPIQTPPDNHDNHMQR